MPYSRSLVLCANNGHILPEPPEKGRECFDCTTCEDNQIYEDCEDCDTCLSRAIAPTQLPVLLSVFPNLTSLNIAWTAPVPTDGLGRTLEGSSLQFLRKLLISVEWGDCYGEPGLLRDVGRIIDNLHMPVLEEINIRIESLERETYYEDFDTLQSALNGIQSPHLKGLVIDIEEVTLISEFGLCLWVRYPSPLTWN